MNETSRLAVQAASAVRSPTNERTESAFATQTSAFVEFDGAE